MVSPENPPQAVFLNPTLNISIEDLCTGNDNMGIVLSEELLKTDDHNQDHTSEKTGDNRDNKKRNL